MTLLEVVAHVAAIFSGVLIGMLICLLIERTRMRNTKHIVYVVIHAHYQDRQFSRGVVTEVDNYPPSSEEIEKLTKELKCALELDDCVIVNLFRLGE